ncbi:hypothetical protein BDZ89DRAFT_1156928 [Hymenopellis radicata]|nr:hypothetical protein BDZ89DRAFT_1156928 [Hymenopellis radicata]
MSEAVVTFWLVLTVYCVVRFVRPRFWPGAIVCSTLKRSRDAQDRLMGDLHLLTERELVLEERLFCLKKKSQALRARHNELIELGVTVYTRRAFTLYADARALMREMYVIEEELEYMSAQQTVAIKKKWTNREKRICDSYF